ncbi:hypothetical protein ICY20_20740 [Pseudomonas sp. P115]|uniref:PA3371 family protein n=1 Tax=Pseudomonas pisciculturae TaxID=2730413 RepID=UPI0013591C77|nr:PA3371 family protein [Pseudomonas pisciculturae]MBF6030183.1 hypothetical protein [Pseudomonas pisciculturae]
MSKSAWLFFCLTLITLALGLNVSSEEGQITALVAAGISGTLLLITLIVGRRIKFDPVLR